MQKGPFETSMSSGKRHAPGGGSEHGQNKRQKSLPQHTELQQHTETPFQDIRDGKKEPEMVLEDLKKRSKSTAHEGFQEERDAVGANALHVAVLYSKSNCSKAEEGRKRFHHRALGWEEKEAHDRIAIKIWKEDDLAHLRTQAYDHTQYQGETTIHLAIAKRRGDLVKFFLQNTKTAHEKSRLLESRAVGTFDVVGFTTNDGVKRCKFGEHPVCWAAVTNQKQIVDILIEHGAELNCRTRNGDSILHMLVRC